MTRLICIQIDAATSNPGTDETHQRAIDEFVAPGNYPELVPIPLRQLDLDGTAEKYCMTRSDNFAASIDQRPRKSKFISRVEDLLNAYNKCKIINCLNHV